MRACISVFVKVRKRKNGKMRMLKFINDVKRIIQTILTKRITKNSLASSYASLEAILENVGCAIYVRDPQTGHILYANEKYQKFFKKTLEELPLSLSAYRMRPRQKTVCSGKFIPKKETDGLTATAPISSGWMEEK